MDRLTHFPHVYICVSIPHSETQNTGWITEGSTVPSLRPGAPGRPPPLWFLQPVLGPPVNGTAECVPGFICFNAGHEVRMFLKQDTGVAKEGWRQQRGSGSMERCRRRERWMSEQVQRAGPEWERGAPLRQLGLPDWPALGLRTNTTNCPHAFPDLAAGDMDVLSLWKLCRSVLNWL